MALQSGVVLANATFEEILDDLSSRFIINVPDVELKSVERICFQVEQAHWFYEDFVRELKPELPSFQLKTFSAKIFKHCPLLRQWAHEHERAYADFMQYRFRIPVCGAIMINAALDKCVLVKGWSSKSGWGFPKGKINQDEEYDCCAIREVLEETGYDVEPLLKQQDYIELTMREQRIRLYLIVGVPEDTDFVPRTRKEISEIAWFKFDELPTYKAINNVPEAHIRTGGYRFYMVVPFQAETFCEPA
ncbi:Dcp2, box A domain-containing protein [Phycomyces blakesleeanus]